MANKIKNLILFFILCFAILSVKPAFCYVLSADELKNKINTQVLNMEQGNILKYSNDYKINITGIPNTDIIVDDINDLKIEVISQNQSYTPNSYKRVLIKNQKDQIIKSFPINVQTLIYKDVLVASKAIQYNEEINLSNTNIEQREISKYLDKILTNIPQNSSSKRNYQKGSIILSDLIKKKSIITKDTNVYIVFQSPKGLNIKIQGKALKEGGVGEKIPVRSDKYNKIYTATIVSENEVVVRI